MAASIANTAVRDVIAGEYAPAAAGHQMALRRELEEALREIDRQPRLQQTIEKGSVDTQAAFDIWRQTRLARSRVAADVELQGVPHHVVSWRWEGAPARLFLNAATGLPTAVEVVRAFPYSTFWGVWGDVN